MLLLSLYVRENKNQGPPSLKNTKGTNNAKQISHFDSFGVFEVPYIICEGHAFLITVFTKR
jgi:hypothetical protein